MNMQKSTCRQCGGSYWSDGQHNCPLSEGRTSELQALALKAVLLVGAVLLASGILGGLSFAFSSVGNFFVALLVAAVVAPVIGFLGTACLWIGGGALLGHLAELWYGNQVAQRDERERTT